MSLPLSRTVVRVVPSESEAVALAWSLSDVGCAVHMRRDVAGLGWAVVMRPFSVHSAMTVDRSAVVEREQGSGTWVITLHERLAGGDL